MYLKADFKTSKIRLKKLQIASCFRWYFFFGMNWRFSLYTHILVCRYRLLVRSTLLPFQAGISLWTCLHPPQTKPKESRHSIPIFFYIAGLYVTLNLNSIPDKTLKNTMSVTRTFHCSTFSSWVITLNFCYFFFYCSWSFRPENGFYKFKQKWKAKL